MKINMNEIHQYIEQGNLTELSRRTGISYRTMQDWKGSQSGWLINATDRFEDMQNAIDDMKNEFKIDGTTYRFYEVSNMSTQDGNKYTAYVVIDDVPKNITIPKKFVLEFLERNYLNEGMELEFDNELNFEFTRSPYVFKFGNSEYLTSTLEFIPSIDHSVGYTATNVRTGAKTLFFTTPRQDNQLYIIREAFKALDDYRFEEITDYLSDEFDFKSFAHSDDKLINEMWNKISDGFYI